MADNIDEQLVQEIVERVLVMVRNAQAKRESPNGQGGATQHESTATAQAHEGVSGRSSVRIRPPAGVCTGDYSQFTELVGRSVGAAPPRNSGIKRDGSADNQQRAPQMQQGAYSPLALTGIVTAQQLQEAIDLTPDGVARLAHDARLTPLANDFARQHPEKIQRVGRPDPSTGSSSGGGALGTSGFSWLWWADGHNSTVQSMMGRLGAQLRPSTAPRNETGLIQVIGDLAEAIGGGHVQGGLLFVRRAARAACFANRCRSLRAIVGTCPESVEQGIHDLGANTLIIEYPHVDAKVIEPMLQHMLQSQPKSPADVQRHLNELQRNGWDSR